MTPATLLLATLAASPLVPGEPEPLGAVRLWDGRNAALAWRTGPAGADGRTPVRLLYPDLGLEVSARVGAAALVVGDPSGLPQVRILAPLMPAAGVWLVASAAAGEDGLDLAARLRDDPGVRSIFPDLYVRRRPAWVPNDPELGAQWYFERLDMEATWDLERGDAGVAIVAIDTGCDLDHPDLAAKLDPGDDPLEDDDDPAYNPADPDSAHGTAVAGLIAAATDNGVGIAGACPECRLRCVRLLDASLPDAPLSADIRAFDFAYDTGAAVVSNSWGYDVAFAVPAALAEAIEALFDSGRGGLGALVFFAAGNDDREVFSYELLGVRGVVGVGAVDQFSRATQYTNHGEPLDLSAPSGTWATDIAGAAGNGPGDYAPFGGTSAACPVAAGVAGLVASADPTLTAAEILALLVDTARPAPLAVPNEQGHDPTYGYGILDPPAAVEAALGLTGGAGGSGGTGGSGASGGSGATGGGGSGGGTPPSGCNAAASSGATLVVVAAACSRRRRRAR